jgi:hypothetical protein
MNYKPCSGPRQDDTGAWYCPMDPDEEDYDCVACERGFDAAVDRAVEASWERDTWG